MSVARTARRRRKQAAMGYRHMAPLDRPIYPGKRSLEKSAAINARLKRTSAISRKK